MLSEDVTRAVSCAVRARPGLSMDDLILCCAPFSWNQVFLALDKLIRDGAVTLRPGRGMYMISPSGTTISETPHTAASTASHPRSQI